MVAVVVTFRRQILLRMIAMMTYVVGRVVVARPTTGVAVTKISVVVAGGALS